MVETMQGYGYFDIMKFLTTCIQSSLSYLHDFFESTLNPEEMTVSENKFYPQNFESHVEAPREHDLKYFNAKVSTKWIDMIRNSNQIYC